MKTERWVLASSEQQSLRSLSDFFLLNPALSQQYADERILQAMSQLMLGEKDVFLVDVL